MENYNLKRDASGGVGGGRLYGTRGEQPSTSSSVIGYRDLCGKCGARRIDAQIGLEESPELFVAKLVEVFREVKRVLRDDATLWLNLGDSFQDKQLLGIPWRVAFALQADGWILRSDIIWAKPNPMPESVTSRPTKSHEYIFLLSKSASYYYDNEAIAEAASQPLGIPKRTGQHKATELGAYRGMYADTPTSGLGTNQGASTRNRRSVWTIPTKPYDQAHFAVFPTALIEPCILAGSKVGDTVLDPFAGSGTTLAVALKHHRNAIGIELNASYIELARRRIERTQPYLEGINE